MKGLQVVALAGAVAALGGCSTTGTDGVVKIGPDLYMLGRLGGFSDFSGSAVKGRLFSEAGQYCASQGKEMVPVSSTSKDSAPAVYASAEVQFRCQ
ncbi:MAG: hypothetical protein E7H60_23075 [Pseudomonas oryzihabitans]|uniref:hypothetical protein n=1 Tax=Pseudomonas oryzihabitans TaxID=47885 RepID=UPI0021D8B732|nr:hypothetical protein [Pseudomonas oryzihabitans]MDU4059432.1 hypothetical protein [Pseudomonas oryzihabitans]